MTSKEDSACSSNFIGPFIPGKVRSLVLMYNQLERRSKESFIFGSKATNKYITPLGSLRTNAKGTPTAPRLMKKFMVSTQSSHGNPLWEEEEEEDESSAHPKDTNLVMPSGAINSTYIDEQFVSIFKAIESLTERVEEHDARFAMMSNITPNQGESNDIAIHDQQANRVFIIEKDQKSTESLSNTRETSPFPQVSPRDASVPIDQLKELILETTPSTYVKPSTEWIDGLTTMPSDYEPPISLMGVGTTKPRKTEYSLDHIKGWGNLNLNCEDKYIGSYDIEMCTRRILG